MKRAYPFFLFFRHVWWASAALVVWLTFSPSHGQTSDTDQVVDYYDGLRAWDHQDKELAVSIWTNAAANGDLRAMKALAEEYRNGTVLPQDFALALFWLEVAARFGDDEAVLTAGNVQREMQPDVVAAARKAAADWQPASRFADAALGGTMLARVVAAIETGDVPALNKAFEEGFSPVAEDDGVPIFLLALARGDLEIIKSFLAADDAHDLLAISVQGLSPLHIAAAKGDVAVIRALVGHGYDPAIEDNNGLLPHGIARAKGLADASGVLEQTYALRRSEIAEQLTTWGYLSSSEADESSFRSAVAVAKRRILDRDDARIDQAFVDVIGDPNRLITYDVLIERSEGERRFIMHEVLPARSRASAEKQALRLCIQGYASATCGRAHASPKGLCIAYAWGASRTAYVSELQPTAAAAVDEAMDFCAQASEKSCQMGKSQPCSG